MKRHQYEILYRYYRGDKIADIAATVPCMTESGIKSRFKGFKYRRPRGPFTGPKREAWIKLRPVMNLKSKYKLMHERGLA